MAVKLGVGGLTVLAALIGGYAPAVANDSEITRIDTTIEPVIEEPAAADAAYQEYAQFAVPKRGRRGKKGTQGKKGVAPKAPAIALPKVLTYQYSIGSDLEFVYVRDADLDSQISDDSLIATPTVAAAVTYRPVKWFETAGELSFDRPIALREEESPIVLPDGSLQSNGAKNWNLNFTQLYARLRFLPFELTVGRQTLSDPRLWLYDADLDGIHARTRIGDFGLEASLTQEDLVDLDFFNNTAESRIYNYIFYTEYRGLEDHRLGAYAMYLRDMADASEGRRQYYGVRAHGKPINSFDYWTELSTLRGSDETGRGFEGYALDIGGKYRFLKYRLLPTLTLSYAWGSGDGARTSGDNKNYRQTGLQGNTAKFGGVTEFQTYGEVLDPELSNLKIFTAGVGFRPAAGTFVDFVYHKYRQNAAAAEVRNWGLTAEMNQVATEQSKDVGDGFDIIVGFRNMFGVRGLGADLQFGVFFPGRAFDNPGTGRRSDNAYKLTATILY